ncbi:MAG: glycerophosphodiester phosphodiesterase [Candidatus Anammoximicrobium sp.]|nr:glycerophosphodiester phosphodiesterase [Candidatus Anammoximicrobium sp.]
MSTGHLCRYQKAFCVAGICWLLLASMDAAAELTPPVQETFTMTDGKLPAGWRPVTGKWSVEGGALVGEALPGEGLITFGDPSWQNYEFEVTATFLEVRDELRWLALVIRAANDGAVPWSQFTLRQKSSSRNGTEFAVRTADGWSVRRTAAAKGDAQLGRSCRLRVVVRGTMVEGYLDSQGVITSPFCLDRPAGCVGLAISGCRARFDDVTLRRLPDTPPLPRVEAGPREVVAHRGFSAAAPENTLAAIRQAISAGADGCEFDVYRCRDGAVVLMHDATVDRTTSGRGKVTELTLAELKQLDAGQWKAAQYAGEKVPTLEEALQQLKDSGCQAVIEIKMEGIAQQVVDAVRAAGMLDQATVIAFSKDVVRDVRRLAPELPCAWLCSPKTAGTAAEQAAWLADQAAECGTKLVDLNYGALSPSLLDELRRRGLTVWAWTVNDPLVIEALAGWGVVSITTDYPDRARAVLPRKPSSR